MPIIRPSTTTWECKAIQGLLNTWTYKPTKAGQCRYYPGNEASDKKVFTLELALNFAEIHFLLIKLAGQAAPNV